MAGEELIKLAPGFKQDRDEDWMVYSSIKIQSIMRTERSKFIAIRENYHALISAFKHSKTSDPVEIKKFEETKRKFEEKIRIRASKLIKDIEKYKQEAEEAKKAIIREEKEALRKRQRLEECDTDVIDVEDVELVADDYLPNFLPYDEEKDDTSGPTVPVHYSPMTNMTSEPTPMDVCGSLYVDENSFLKDIDPDDVEILTNLKPLILKYNCRDRVLKAIKSIRRQEKTFSALEAFTAEVAKQKSSKSK